MTKPKFDKGIESDLAKRIEAIPKGEVICISVDTTINPDDFDEDADPEYTVLEQLGTYKGAKMLAEGKKASIYLDERMAILVKGGFGDRKLVEPEESYLPICIVSEDKIFLGEKEITEHLNSLGADKIELEKLKEYYFNKNR